MEGRRNGLEPAEDGLGNPSYGRDAALEGSAMIAITRSSRGGAVFAAALCMWAGGCGSGGPELVPLTGTVTLDGEPVEGASVTFMPQFTGQPATGTTDVTGKFSLRTHPHGEGVMPGKHKVTVQKMEISGLLPDDQGLSGGIAPGGIQETWHTPKRYASPETSDLVVEVEPGMEPVEVKLKSE